MFMGEYEHSIDAKGRVILPVKFRDELRAKVRRYPRFGRLSFCLYDGGVDAFGRQFEETPGV